MSKNYLLIFFALFLGSVSPAYLSAQTISLYAGSAAGTGGYIGDGTGLTSYELSGNEGICFDKNGNMYIADHNNNRIRMISGNVISTIAGTGVAGYTGDGTAATNARINGPVDVVVDGNLNVYFTDQTNNAVREIIASSGNIITVAGNGTAGYTGDGAPATNYELNQPVGIAIGRDGNLYIADQFNTRIRKLTPSGTISTFAGGATGGFSGDGGPATAAKMSYPMFLHFDMWGNLFFFDRENNRCRVISAGATPAQNIINTVIGHGAAAGFSGDDGPATGAVITYVPGGLRFDGAGNLYFADGNNFRIREVFVPEIPGSTGVVAGTDTINTIAGTGTGSFTGDGGPASAATFKTVYDVAVDSVGNYWVSDGGNNVIRYINIHNGRPRFSNGTFQSVNVCENSVGDSIWSLLSAYDSNAVVKQKITWNILKPPTHGVAYAFDTLRSNGGTLTPHGAYYTPNENYSGYDTLWVWVNDGYSMDTTELIVHVRSFYAGEITTEPAVVCPGSSITLSADTSGGGWSSSYTYVATVSSGLVDGLNAGVAMMSYSISNTCGTTYSAAKVTVGDPTIITIAGNGTAGSTGNGVAATTAEINDVEGMAIDAIGNLYIADFTNNKVRKITPAGIISNFAGTGTAGSTGDGGPAVSAELSAPTSVAIDASGNIYIAEQGSDKVRIVNTAGTIGTFAGTGAVGYSGDGGPATGARFDAPSGLAVDPSGNVYIADFNANVVRMVTPSHIISTFAGNGTAGYTGDGGAATAAELNFPYWITTDARGNLYISDVHNNVIREVMTTNLIRTFAGNGTGGFAGDDGPATAAELNNNGGLAVDQAGNLYISDQNSHRIRVVNTSGIIATVAGTGTPGYNGDNIPATAAELNFPSGVVIDDTGNLIISDQDNFRIRKIIAVAPAVPPITGASAVCIGSTISLSNDTTDGTWSSANPGVGSISSSGVVTGVAAGTATISYGILYACGLQYTSTVITVNGPPSAISGTPQMCVTQSTTLTDASGAGTWSSSNSSIASVPSSTSGGVTGVAPGTATITFTLNTTGCKTTQGVTVQSTPGVISGSLNLCTGYTSTLTDAGYSGTWVSTNTAVATIGLGSGVLSGVSQGTSLISFTVGTGCYATAVATVNQSPSTITPSATECPGMSQTLSSSPSGGAWTSSNVAVGTISSSGFFSELSAGTTIISYTLGSGCFAAVTVTVNALPNPITGSFSICDGSSATLGDASSGGSWISSNTTVATIGSGSGSVSGVSVGSSIISYIITATGCYRTATETVVTAPGPITGALDICVGGTTSLTDGGSGTWTSTNIAVGTISTGGVLTGVGAGTETISYSLGTGCVATANATVYATPLAIGGVNHLCQGQTTTLTEATGGGTWSSSNSGVASVTTGTVTAVAAGTATISYTMPSGCYSTFGFTVNPSPAAIGGNAPVCAGVSDNLSDGTSGGAWSTSNGAVATVGSTGTFTGVGQGTATISYTLGAGCLAWTTVTVNPNPAAISPATILVCPGQAASFTDGSGSGAWSSSNTAVGTISGSGGFGGVSSGTVTISYTLGTGCYAVASATVSAAPTSITPTSPSVCVGASLSLGDGIGGGVWTSNATAYATVGSSSGSVTGVATGSAIITYTLGSCYTTTTVTVNGLLNPGVITGASVMCASTPITLSESAGGGVWTSGNTAVATVGAISGTVTGVSSGTVIISYSVTNVCGAAVATHTINVSIHSAGTIAGPALLCAGTFANYTDAAGGGAWSLANSSATIAGTGLLTGITPGTNIVTYSVTNTCGTSTTTKTITIGAFLTAGTITGSSTHICQGATLLLSDLAPGGGWSAGNGDATVSGGLVTGVSGGVDTISYTVTSGCGSAYAIYPLTVIPLPNAGSIAGPDTICIGSPTNYTDAVSGGVWTIETATASISGSGLVTPLATGTNIITYTYTNACGSAYTTQGIVIQPALAAGFITGGGIVCAGAALSLADATTGGVWSVQNANATVAGGLVTGVAGGTDIVSYTVTNGCGSLSATHPVTIIPLPGAGTITGPATACVGATATYTDPASGGVWSVENTSASISGGLLTALATGTNIVSYSVTNFCGTAVAVDTITIGLSPSAGTITGPGYVCTGSPVTLADGVLGGTWSASNTNASISGSGIVTGFTAGLDTIAYTVTNSCGTASATDVITVNLSASPGVVMGPAAVCAGTFTIYTDTASGGFWSVTNGAATITGAGVLSAITPGTIDTVEYTVSNVCGAATAMEAVSIGASLTAGTISGPAGVCRGAAIGLSDPVTGGTWSSGNISVATVSGGAVTGVAAGTATISYTVTLVCGTAVATQVVTVSPPAVAGTIYGPTTVCAGSSITVAETSGGGAWSLTNGDASITGGGMITGVTAGADTVVYTVSNYCGTASASMPITVNPMVATGTISGSPSVCAGSAVTLSDSYLGGVWSSSNPLVAAVGSSSGVVTGVAGGYAAINYTIATSCGSSTSTLTMTVNALPAPGSITGPPAVCVGSIVTLADAAPGGAWSAANGNATITFGGAVTGVTPGLDTIAYTVSNVCGVASATFPMIVSVSPTAGTISGPANICMGATGNYIDGVSGGVWSSSNTAIASIGSMTGVASGIATGGDNIIYTVTNACGTASATMAITVDPTLTAGVITGLDTVCPGSSTPLADTISGGVWGATNANATVSFAGVVTGVTPGLDTIYYSVTSVCGTVLATRHITILPIPGPGVITGSSTVCVGGATALSDASVGGVWSAGGTDATISGSGVVTGVSAGTATVYYTVTNMCGTNTDSKAMTVNAGPAVAAITGDASECVGTATTVHDATSGGAWSSTNIAVATIGEYTGIVTGVGAGTVTLLYTVTDMSGCTTSATVTDTVSVMPVASPISGPASVCAGAQITLSNTMTGGVWSSEYLSLATVNPATGVVTGVAAGTDKIYYTVTTGCGAVRDSASITVNAAPSAGVISAAYTTLCSGVTLHLSESVAGGVWGSTDPAVAAVSTGGVVTGIATGSVDITYKVTNLSGCSATASIALTIGGASPTGTITPGGSLTLCHGHTITLDVAASAGTTTYQWLRNGSAITGANTAAYTANTAGVYAVDISNGVCSATISGPSVSAPPVPVISFIYPDELSTGSFISYQWYLNGAAIAGANSPTYLYTQGGLYTVVVTDVNGCVDTSIAYAVSGVSVVNNVNGSAEVRVYPNPVSTVLYIDAPMQVTVRVMSLAGNQLIEAKNATGVDVSALADGLYMIQVFDESGVLVKTARFTKMQ